MSDRKKCIGLWGWIFGHRFTVISGGYEVTTNFCGRCGMRAGL